MDMKCRWIGVKFLLDDGYGRRRFFCQDENFAKKKDLLRRREVLIC